MSERGNAACDDEEWLGQNLPEGSGGEAGSVVRGAVSAREVVEISLRKVNRGQNQPISDTNHSHYNKSTGEICCWNQCDRVDCSDRAYDGCYDTSGEHIGNSSTLELVR
jgi:hypothetical protein